jgi:hypothetical protein
MQIFCKTQKKKKKKTVLASFIKILVKSKFHLKELKSGKSEIFFYNLLTSYLAGI